MIPRAATRLLLAAALAALGCTRTTELADWGDTGGEDGGVDDVIEMDCSACPAEGAGLANLRCALDLCDPDVVLNGDGEYREVTTYRLGVADQTCTLDDTREAIARFGDATNDLEPRLNGSYAIMTSGDWDAPLHMTSCSPVPEEDSGTDGYEYDSNPGAEGDVMYDAVEWKLQLRAPEDAKSFSFNYVFFSIEYDDFISSDANDKFYAEIKAASTNDGEATVINFTACRDEEAYFDFECTPDIALTQGCTQGVNYCYVAINSALSECCWYNDCPDGTAETSIEGTGYECAGSQLEETSEHGSSTGWLSTRWPIDGGEEFTLTFHIHDTMDSTRDSAVILDAFRFYRKFSSGGTVVIE
ncbi:MAG: choice-of-anchor L domain-containing protein [Proteobacteria bacterium]|jgi:hypothetical protein|nr:choice-of-anchor L domain-containing protein [Pseudomonadota bacterium]